MNEIICPILSIQRTGNAFDFTLDAFAMDKAAQCGQFVMVKCAEHMSLRRPISICDAETGTLRLGCEARGEGTKWLSERTVGESLNLLAPLGHGFDLSCAGERPLVVLSLIHI